MDFRAHGSSTGPDPSSGALSWTGMADDVLAVIDHLTSRPNRVGVAPVGIGHSMGGACLMAAEHRRPGLLRGAFLFEPIIVPTGWGRTAGPNPMAESARRRRSGFASREEALARYASRPPLNMFRADALAAYIDHGFRDLPDGTVALCCSPDAEAQTFEADGKPTITQMADIGVPTVIAFGTHEPGPSPADFAPLVAETLPNGTARVYPHLGHFGPLQDPDTIADDAVDFFAGLA
jgi:pimeloyl-ACP methyl ester carboxylesterase